MSDIYSAITLNPADADKIRQHLEKIKLAQATSPDAESAIAAASQEFNQFFEQYGKPYFTAHEFKTNDTARSSVYNENLITLDGDVARLYNSLESAAKATLTAFNFTTIISKEITDQANANASKVLDLNILNGYVKGQVIVAGDDFVDQAKIDKSIGIDTTRAEIMQGANALSLKIDSSIPITNPNVKVSITPVKPVGQDGNVNTAPTPLNLERFYEGKYYAFLGQQEPEGGVLQLKYIVNPASIPSSISTTTVNGQPVSQQDQVGAEAIAKQAQNNANFYAVVPATEDQKIANRSKMFDGNPDTYWQCEFVYKIEPLQDPLDNDSIDLESNNG